MNEVRLLVVDGASSRQALVALLEGEGYRVHAIDDGVAARSMLESFRPHLALFNGDVAIRNGRSLARRLREAGVPIMFIVDTESRVNQQVGFKTGFDDYVVKPFNPEELRWRVRATLRRSGHAGGRVWECGAVVVDEDAQAVTVAGSSVSLTGTEFRLLGVLVRNCRRVVPMLEVLEQVWGHRADKHLVEVHLSALRRKLEAHGPRVIHTIRGAGYVLRP